eukprot:1317473-Pyramimonas_sp.AAC.1
MRVMAGEAETACSPAYRAALGTDCIPGGGPNLASEGRPLGSSCTMAQAQRATPGAPILWPASFV